MKQLGLLCSFALLVLSQADPLSPSKLQSHDSSMHRAKRQAGNEAACSPRLVTLNQEGTISSPQNGETYAVNRVCRWRLRAPAGKHVLVAFSYFDLQESNRCSRDFLQIKDGRNFQAPDILKECGNRTLPAVISSTNFLYIQFKSDRSGVARGFEASFFFVDEPTTPAVMEPQSQSAMCGSGGTPLTSATGTIQSPSDPQNPGEYPNNAECIWRISAPSGKLIKLTATSMQLEGGSGCPFDYVDVHDGETENSLIMDRFCGTTFPTAGLTSTGSEMYVKFVSDESLTFAGFVFEWEFVDPEVTSSECGGMLTQSSGTIQSPRSGNNGRYPNNANCRWIIDVGEGNMVKLEFTSFDVENVQGCIYDSVTVHDGQDTNSPKLGTFCGKDTPAPQVSSGRYLMVVFTSDGSVRKAGFSADYSVASEDEGPKEHPGCGSSRPEVLSESEGLVTSPTRAGSGNYPDNSFCQWRIEVPSDKKAHLRFDSFNLEDHRACAYDRLEVFDGASITDNQLGRFCGGERPGDLTASTNILLIQFTSDYSVTAPGFSITYSAKDPSGGGDGGDGGEGGSDGEPPCGISEFPPKMGRIVGGREATAHSWPWQISLRYRGGHTCGGSVASKRWVITAAHCVHGRDSVPGLFSIVAGEHDMKTTENTEQVITVQRIIKHEGYNSRTIENDIALLELAEDIQYTAYVRPVCFPTVEAPTDMLCTTTGWGSTEGTGDSTVLNEVDVPILSRDLCRQPDWYGSAFTEPMICAGYANGGKDSCQGDSGGPLVCRSNGLYILQGLTSWGFGCADPKNPGIYTRMAVFQGWVESNIPGKYQARA